MPTTTNFGWTTPADTDLVKDGAAAIRTFAGNVDTSLVDLKGGTSGQYLTKNSNTDLDYAWVDLSAGGMTLISTTTLTGASVTLSAIPGTYKNLQLVIQNFRPASDRNFRVRMNADASANRHINVGAGSDVAFTATSIDDILGSQQDGGAASQALIVLDILDYANTTTWKMLSGVAINNNGGTPANVGGSRVVGAYNQTSAISSLELLCESGTSFTSGTALLYGVK